jgi:hypothetical protein
LAKDAILLKNTCPGKVTMLRLNENLYSLEYDEELDCWILTWHEYVSSNEFREIQLRVVEQLENTSPRKMIRDTRNLNILSAEDQQWFLEVIVPQMIIMGLKAVAVIIPKNLLAKMSIEDVTSKIAPNGVDTRLFSDIDTAREWLKSI